MAVESSKGTGEDQVESLIDDLIRDIFNESGGAPESPPRGTATAAALFEKAFGSARGPRVSALERLLLAEAFAHELAEALAPALAEQLATRLVKALDQLTADEAASGKPASAARPSGQGRKPEAK